MHIRVPQYSGKDYVVLAIVNLPLTVVINSFIFGSRYFTDGAIFLPSTLATAALMALDFLLCGYIAAAMKKRMPRGAQTPRRLFYMILCFVALSGLFLMIAFSGYESITAF